MLTSWRVGSSNTATVTEESDVLCIRKGHVRVGVDMGGPTRISSDCGVREADTVVTPTSIRSAVEKRRRNRLRVIFPARYVSSSLTLEGRVTDVSAEGLFFCADFLDDEGEVARLWVQVPSRPQPLELRGEVRWVNDAPGVGGMGLRLVDVSLEDRAILSALGVAPPETEMPASSGNA